MAADVDEGSCVLAYWMKINAGNAVVITALRCARAAPHSPQNFHVFSLHVTVCSKVSGKKNNIKKKKTVIFLSLSLLK